MFNGCEQWLSLSPWLINYLNLTLIVMYNTYCIKSYNLYITLYNHHHKTMFHQYGAIIGRPPRRPPAAARSHRAWPVARQLPPALKPARDHWGQKYKLL